MLDDGRWVVELRRRTRRGTRALERRRADDWTSAPTRTITFDTPYLDSERLWVARARPSAAGLHWLAEHGQPIRYGYVDRTWPIESYQNVYATDPGSAEMPSAGRPLTAEMITRLVAKGVGVAPLVLHTGVASLESTELPVSRARSRTRLTAERVNETHRLGGRVIAVGTTVVRALETAGDDLGCVSPFDGWTDLVITPERGVRVVDGLLTGWHEPEASHLLMLEAVAGRDLLEASYAAQPGRGLPVARVRRHAPDPAVSGCRLPATTGRPHAPVELWSSSSGL